MRPADVRALRAGLLALVIGLAGAVTWLLRHSPAVPPPPSAPPAAMAARTEHLVYRTFKGDKVNFTLQAESEVGREQDDLHLRGVVLTFTYIKQGAEDTATISSDDCVYTPAVQKAVFRGHVHVHTGEGFELATEELIYRGDKGLARSEDRVEFRRKAVSGTSKGMTYHAEEGRLELASEVALVIADDKRPEMRIRAGRADAERAEGAMRFVDGVEVTQGPDVLKAARLNINFTPEQTIYRAVAVDDVDLQASSAGLLPANSGALASGGGRHLRCTKLDLWFRPDRSVKEATAGPDADLVAMSGPREPPERRHLKARFIVFRFDDQGRLEEVQAQKDSTFVAETLPPAAPAPPRTLDCQGFIARLDAATGEAREIEFNKDIVFRQGKRLATAQSGWYQGKDGLLLLKETPRLVDEERGSELLARAIDLGTKTGDVAARHEVRNVMTHQRGAGKAGLLGSDAPVIVTARFFDYEAKTRTATYREEALLRSGRDEIRAPEIRYQEDDAGKRRLHAIGGVVSLLHPRPAPGEKTAETMEGRAREMVYDEAKGQIVYKGDVSLRQGDIATRSPEATIVLTADGSAVERLMAGDPVEFRQGTRVANGSHGTYTPASGSVELMGEQVTLKDATQQVRGRALTFNLRDDRVIVDGKEQMRTETVMKKTPPRP